MTTTTTSTFWRKTVRIVCGRVRACVGVGCEKDSGRPQDKWNNRLNEVKFVVEH